MSRDDKPLPVSEPKSFEFEVRWDWVTGAELASILAKPTKDGEPGNADQIDVLAILSKKISWVVEVDEDGNTTAIVGSPVVGSIDPELMRRALVKLGARIERMSAFEAVSRPWTSVEARKPWAGMVGAALEAMAVVAEAGESLTERYVLEKGLPTAARPRIFKPL
ncbi:hypothetical protein GCM10009552_28920 [Rothia nasimurium]|uniref:Uncharacterized protein n=1 Tax=Luteibacter anthropi TaxID=564369 RepID=A0A7X5UAJ8_9GAMM|nr:hypothetical protein [Luteibacter anthropi]NII06914.1 hypothetical protein [Luteibacter anthropi]